VLESYNSDCPFCNNQYKTGAMQELEKDMAAKGVVWLIVNSVNPTIPATAHPTRPDRKLPTRNHCGSLD